MPTIKTNKKQMQFLQRTADKRFIYFYGGAGSGKSWTIAPYLIIEKLLQQPGIGILALRKTKPAVKTSCLKLIKYWLIEMELEFKENKSEMTITMPNGSFIHFDSIDDIEKKKSIEGINYIWLEEATEFTGPEVRQLNLRCRAHNAYGINQLFFTFNPVDPVGNEWLKNLSDNAQSHRSKTTGKFDSAVMMVTHVDNAFLSAEERAQIEELADLDEEFDKIYRQGLWATPTHIIYSNWDIIDHFPDNCDMTLRGLDFGFNNPSAMVKIGVKDVYDVYIDEEIYESKLTNGQLIDRMNIVIRDKDTLIAADSAEPARIEEIAIAGYNVYPVEKTKGEGGKNFVASGIDKIKRVRLHITSRSVNVIKEIKGYKWKMDKDENVLDEPVAFKDHSMDAIRYALGGVPTVEPELEVIGEYDF